MSFLQGLHAVWFVALSVLAHNGEIHEFSGTECRSSVIAGHFVRNNSSEVVAYRYGDYVAQIILESGLSTESPKLVKHTNSQVVSITGSTYRSQEETYIIQQTDTGVSLYLYNSAKTIQIPWECSGNRLREYEGHVFIMNSITGQLCLFDDVTNQWSLFWKPDTNHSMLWPSDYVTFVSFDVIDMNTVVFYYNTEKHVTTVARIQRDQGGQETLDNYFSSGICNSEPGRDAVHCGGDVWVVRDSIYVFTGEGAMSNIKTVGDTEAQRLDSYNGKVIRIGLGGSLSPTPVILATGLRHPWTVGYDGLTDTFQIADVGDALFEEITFVSTQKLNQGGLNFGWPMFEGNMPVTAWRCPGPHASFIFPDIVQSHDCDTDKIVSDMSWVKWVGVLLATCIPLTGQCLISMYYGPMCTNLPIFWLVSAVLVSNLSAILCYLPFVEYNTGAIDMDIGVGYYGRHHLSKGREMFGFLEETYTKDSHFVPVSLYPMLFFAVHQLSTFMLLTSVHVKNTRGSSRHAVYQRFIDFGRFVVMQVYVIHIDIRETCNWITPKDTSTIAYILLVYSVYDLIHHGKAYTHPTNNGL